MGARIEATDGRAPLTIDGGALTAITLATAGRERAGQERASCSPASPPTGVDDRRRAAADTRSHGARVPGVRPDRATSTGRRLLQCAGGQAAVARPAARSTCPATRRRRPCGPPRRRRCPGRPSQLDGVCLNPQRLGFVGGAASAWARTIDVMTRPARSPASRSGRLRVRHAGHAATSIDARRGAEPDRRAAGAGGARGAGRRPRGVAAPANCASRRATASRRSSPGFRALGVDADERPDGFVIDGVAAADRRHGRRGGRSSARHGVRARRARARRGPTTITDADAVARVLSGLRATTWRSSST